MQFCIPYDFLKSHHQEQYFQKLVPLSEKYYSFADILEKQICQLQYEFEDVAQQSTGQVPQTQAKVEATGLKWRQSCHSL